MEALASVFMKSVNGKDEQSNMPSASVIAKNEKTGSSRQVQQQLMYSQQVWQ